MRPYRSYSKHGWRLRGVAVQGSVAVFGVTPAERLAASAKVYLYLNKDLVTQGQSYITKFTLRYTSSTSSSSCCLPFTVSNTAAPFSPEPIDSDRPPWRQSSRLSSDARLTSGYVRQLLTGSPCETENCG